MDKRVFNLIAKCDNQKHLVYETNYSAPEVIFYICNKNLIPGEFIDSLKKCLSEALNWEIDLSSFINSCLPAFSKFETELYLRSTVESLTRKPVSYRSQNDEDSSFVINFINAEELSPDVTNIVECESLAKTWAETPPNFLTPDKFVAEIANKAKELNVDCQIFDWNELHAKGFNLMCAVGQNKKNSYLVILRQRNKTCDNRKKIALIGKGICFDTGGLSLKTGNYMNDMKFDMSGASLAASIFFSIAKNNYSKDNELIAVLPISENLIGSESIKVDSVLKSFGGLSVEITNTDAEGRLLLAESISYAASELDVSEIITVATLTGAVKYALGTKYAGAWATSEDSWINIEKASKYAGDWLWRLPLDKSYLKDIKGKIADLKNSATTGAGGASRAATFLSEFRKEKEFIHFDIANVANTEDKGKVSLAPLFKTIYFYIKGIH